MHDSLSWSFTVSARAVFVVFRHMLLLLFSLFLAVLESRHYCPSANRLCQFVETNTALPVFVSTNCTINKSCTQKYNLLLLLLLSFWKLAIIAVFRPFAIY